MTEVDLRRCLAGMAEALAEEQAANEELQEQIAHLNERCDHLRADRLHALEQLDAARVILNLDPAGKDALLATLLAQKGKAA